MSASNLYLTATEHAALLALARDACLSDPIRYGVLIHWLESRTPYTQRGVVSYKLNARSSMFAAWLSDLASLIETELSRADFRDKQFRLLYPVWLKLNP